jgi:hypothetical protein
LAGVVGEWVVVRISAAVEERLSAERTVPQEG